MNRDESIMKKILGLTIVVLSLLILLVPSSQASGDINHSYYYYGQLDDNERAIYDTLCNASPSIREIDVTLPISITLKGEDAENMIVDILNKMVKRIRFAIEFGEPMSTWGWYGCTMGLSGIITTNADSITLAGVKATLDVSAAWDDPETSEDELAEKHLSLRKVVDVFTPKSTDRRGIVGEINQYLMDTVTYDPHFGNSEKESPYAHDAYGALATDNHYAVCDGYAKAFMILCMKAEIPCVIDIGSSNRITWNTGHAWNYVSVEDKKWHAIDVTWNDSTNNAYFLKGTDTFFMDHQQGTIIAPNFRSPFLIPSIEDSQYDPLPTSYENYLWIAGIVILLLLGLIVFREIRKNKTK